MAGVEPRVVRQLAEHAGLQVVHEAGEGLRARSLSGAAGMYHTDGEQACGAAWVYLGMDPLSIRGRPHGRAAWEAPSKRVQGTFLPG